MGSFQRAVGWCEAAGKRYGNGFVRCEANVSSGCRFPHVIGVRYRSNSVSIRVCMIGGEHFPNLGSALFITLYLSM